MLLLFKKYKDILFEQTKTKPQETPDFLMDRQMQTFSFCPPITFSKEGKWLLEVIFSVCTNSVFNTTDENNSFSITTLGHWNSKSAEKTFDEPIKLLELRSQNDVELHVEQVRKKSQF